MKKNSFDERENPRVDRDISVANLPPDLIIEDPAEYVREMRATYLKRARQAKGLRLEEVAEKCNLGIEELKRIESGEVDEQDMAILNDLAIVYSIDYPSLLFLFRLARRPDRTQAIKMAACHDQKIDEKTQKDLVEFVEKLKELM